MCRSTFASVDLDTSHGVLWSASVPGSLEGFAAGRAHVAPQERFGGFLLAQKLSQPLAPVSQLSGSPVCYSSLPLHLSQFPLMLQALAENIPKDAAPLQGAAPQSPGSRTPSPLRASITALRAPSPVSAACTTFFQLASLSRSWC